MLAHVIHQKYVNSLPLYRQEEQFRQWGINLSRQTMANWLIAASERWLVPLYDLFHARLLAQDHVHADETTLQILREPGRSAQAKSYLWLYRTGRGAALDVVLYDYRTGRDSEPRVRQFEADFRHLEKWKSSNIKGFRLRTLEKQRKYIGTRLLIFTFYINVRMILLYRQPHF
mgnify:CR=1 FL=1